PRASRCYRSRPPPKAGGAQAGFLGGFRAMPHVAKDFTHLKGSLDGFSDKQLDAHFTLYGGYVAKLNEIEEKLKTADRSKANYTFNEYSELKRRECTAFNGSCLHQLYFEHLAGVRGEPSVDLKKLAVAAFGSWDNY